MGWNWWVHLYVGLLICRSTYTWIFFNKYSQTSVSQVLHPQSRIYGFGEMTVCIDLCYFIEATWAFLDRSIFWGSWNQAHAGTKRQLNFGWSAVIQRISTALGLAPLTPMLFKGQYHTQYPSPQTEVPATIKQFLSHSVFPKSINLSSYWY